MFGDYDYDGVISDGNWDVFNEHYGTVLPAPPDSPNTLTATAALGRGRIDLNWTPPADMTDIAGFHIDWSNDGGVTWTRADTVAAGVNHWTKTGLPDGAAYRFKARAFGNTTGDSMASNTARTVTALPMPDGLTATAIDSTSVALSWTDNSTGASSFQ